MAKNSQSALIGHNPVRRGGIDSDGCAGTVLDNGRWRSEDCLIVYLGLHEMHLSVRSCPRKIPFEPSYSAAGGALRQAGGCTRLTSSRLASSEGQISAVCTTDIAIQSLWEARRYSPLELWANSQLRRGGGKTERSRRKSDV
jgi:hypothetical protein